MCDRHELLLHHGVPGGGAGVSSRCSSREAIDRVLGLLVAAGSTGSSSSRQAVIMSGGGRNGEGTERDNQYRTIKHLNGGQQPQQQVQLPKLPDGCAWMIRLLLMALTHSAMQHGMNARGVQIRSRTMRAMTPPVVRSLHLRQQALIVSHLLLLYFCGQL